MVLLPRAREHLVHPGDVALELVEVRGLLLRIEEALDGVHVVLRDELALRALEGRVLGEVDPRLHLHRVERAVLGDFRHRLERVQHELQRPREVVVLERRIEDVVDEVGGVEIRELGGVEAGLGDLERVAKHLLRGGGGQGEAGGHRGRGQELRNASHQRLSTRGERSIMRYTSTPSVTINCPQFYGEGTTKWASCKTGASS